MKIYLRQNIVGWRNKNRYTQKEVAQMFKLTIGQLKSYESGKAHPDLETVVLFAKKMGVTVDELLLTQMEKSGRIDTPESKLDRVSALELRLDILEEALGAKVSSGVSLVPKTGKSEKIKALKTK